MERNFSTILNSWSRKTERRPLLIKGARQVGKTFEVKRFGTDHFKEQFHVFDFRADRAIRSAFKDTATFSEALQLLEVIRGISFDKDHSLIFFDEIQDAPGGLPSLKYATEEMPNLRIIAAGSHLGMTQNEEPFPVGSIDIETMTPMTFSEFLQAITPQLFDYYNSINVATLSTPIPEALHEKFLEYYRLYLFSGGMPAVVKTFLAHLPVSLLEATNAARKIQLDLVEGFKSDFAKYSGAIHAAHILDVFESIPLQLGKALDEEVKKFVFSQTAQVRTRGFASVRGPLTWLTKARLCIRCYLANRAEIPIRAFTEESRFKLYLFDVGILGAMMGAPPISIVNMELGSYKGYMVENFIAQELFAQGYEDPAAWSEGRSELEFVLQTDSGLIPIEAKSSSKARRAKSLEAFFGRYPTTAQGYKITGQNFGKHTGRPIVTLPIYLAGKLLSSTFRV